MVFRAVIWSCVNRGDWQRANQWTGHFNRWVDRQRVAPFPGLCRLHRADVLTMRGELAKAERELLALRDVLKVSAPVCPQAIRRPPIWTFPRQNGRFARSD